MDLEKEKYINSINLNINTDFPYLALDVVNDKSYPKNLGFQVMHWHDDLQFIYVLSGAIEVTTLDDIVQVKTGEGIFINKNVIHHVKRIKDCHYNSFIFPNYFLEFYAGAYVKSFVDSVVENEQFTFYHFIQGSVWHDEILSVLSQLADIENNKTEFYIYEVLVYLSSLWLTMIKNINFPKRKQKNIVNIRIQKILRYIEENYSENLTLEDLAKSANISKSECSRCFKSSLNTTPYKYLNEIRLLKATQLLKHTNEPIGNIAVTIGFNQMSHFGKCFKEKTGYSPKEYRDMENLK